MNSLIRDRERELIGEIGDQLDLFFVKKISKINFNETIDKNILLEKALPAKFKENLRKRLNVVVDGYAQRLREMIEQYNDPEIK